MIGVKPVRIIHAGSWFRAAESSKKEGRRASCGVLLILTGPTATSITYIVACLDPALLATLSDPSDPRDVRHPLPLLLVTLLVALAGDADSMAAVAAFTHDHRAWF